MKPTSGKKDWRNLIRPLVQKVEPAARLAERVLTFAVQAQGPLTPLKAIGLASVGINTLKDLSDARPPSGWDLDMMVSRDLVLEAFKGGGATVRRASRERHEDVIALMLHGEEIYVSVNGSLRLPAFPSPEFYEWLCQMFNRVLPSVLVIGPGSGNDKYQCTPGKLTGLRSKQGAEIAASTRPLLEGGRSILINGRPGVGKSTMAQEIALAMDLGRTVVLEAGAVGYRKTNQLVSGSTNGKETVSSSGSGSFAMTLQLLSPGVVIIDDVDKIDLPLQDLEAIRQVSKLVILTSNNGEFDDVLDAAEIRPGRIDEVFNVKPEHTNRRPPFDKLSDTDWETVRDWPIASLNELEKRLNNRDTDIRLQDIGDRLTRKTRSGNSMH